MVLLLANFSPAYRAEPGFWKKSFWNESGDYMEKVSAWAENPSPVSKTGLWLKMFSPGWKAEKPHAIAAKFQPGLKREFEQAHWRNIQRNKMAVVAETRHVTATKFQPEERAGISARAEIPNVITPLVGI